MVFLSVSPCAAFTSARCWECKIGSRSHQRLAYGWPNNIIVKLTGILLHGPLACPTMDQCSILEIYPVSVCTKKWPAIGCGRRSVQQAANEYILASAQILNRPTIGRWLLFWSVLCWHLYRPAVGSANRHAIATTVDKRLAQQCYCKNNRWPTAEQMVVILVGPLLAFISARCWERKSAYDRRNGWQTVGPTTLLSK